MDKRDELHSILYYKMVAVLKGVINEDGNYVHDVTNRWGGFRAYRVWQARPSAEFAHQYLRERFLENRDVYVAFNKDGQVLHVLSEKVLTGEVILYKKDMEEVFGKDSELAIEVARELLSKFFKVRVRPRSGVKYYDNSSGRYRDHGEFTKTERV